SPCCSNIYPCHICHDDKEDHALNRYEIKNHECLNCRDIQPVNEKCLKCHVKFAEYTCTYCYIFDELKDQFHCFDCGLCRIGGRHNYFHCITCNMCLAVRFRYSHKVGTLSSKFIDNYLDSGNIGISA
ncbi:hypothetical protein FQA39_LY18659, partial [Lamprigera yunnana]